MIKINNNYSNNNYFFLYYYYLFYFPPKTIYKNQLIPFLSDFGLDTDLLLSPKTRCFLSTNVSVFVNIRNLDENTTNKQNRKRRAQMKARRERVRILQIVHSSESHGDAKRRPKLE